MQLVVSARSPEDLYYATELPGPETNIIYTRQNPPGVDPASGPVARGRSAAPRSIPTTGVYVCGSDGFANTATDLLIAAGLPASSIRVERFGPSG